MSVAVKICGLLDETAVRAAVDAGAAMVGFVFHSGSRHLITPEIATKLAALVPSHIQRVGLFVDADDATLRAILKIVPLDLLQLHGDESPERVGAIRALTGKPVMAAIRLAAPEHLVPVAAYEKVADRLLFDSRVGNQPSGGTGKSFDWSLLRGRSFSKPWMLAGGLNAGNIVEAVRMTGATTIDVSSGVETGGHKDPAKIRELIAIAQRL
jgi:phosphoribosylanthranilate isomerase